MIRSLSLLCALTGALVFASGAFAAPATIAAIQGGGETSTLINQDVTVEAVVTANLMGADKFNGFFIQDPVGDGDPLTSEGLFVYVNDRSPFAQIAISPGDRVQVSGRVSRYKGQTQISSPSKIVVLEHGELLPPQVVTLTPNLNFESLEGMLVRFDQTLVVSAQNDLNRYGTLKLAPARVFNPTNARSIEEVKAAPETVTTITLDDNSNDSYPKNKPYLDDQNTRRTGTTITGLTGIVSEYDGDYRIQPTVPPVLVDANARPLAPPPVGGTLKVAAANVLNYWTTFKNKKNPNARGADNPAQFERQSAKTMAEIKGLDADIVGLMELENNPFTVQEFVRRLNAAYGREEYAAIIDPPEGVAPDAIRVGLIYKPSKVETVGASQVETSEVFDRRPLAQTFRDKTGGGVFTVVVNHFKSKGSAPKDDGPNADTGQGAWNQKRTQQADLVVKFVEQLQQTSGDPDVLVIGDLNAYVEETPLRALREAGLKHLNLRLAPEDRYSFSYDGYFGSLDHALATPSLDAQVTGFGEWHINADEPYFNTYDKIKVDDWRPDPYRASDHDPFVVGLNLTAN